MALNMSWWQALLFLPGRVIMDWLTRTWPEVVIRHDFGFTVESYVFWMMVISVAFWSVLIVLLVLLFRRLRKSRKSSADSG
ncbi:MAG: hypothetical protein WED00_00725 [Aquisalimonadaceae bacterium]